MRRDVEKRIGTDAQLLDLVSADALHPPYEWKPARIARDLVLHLVEPQPAEIDRRELQSGHVVRTLLRADRRNIPRVRAHPRGKPGGEHAFDLGEEIDRGAAITIFEYGDLERFPVVAVVVVANMQVLRRLVFVRGRVDIVYREQEDCVVDAAYRLVGLVRIENRLRGSRDIRG